MERFTPEQLKVIASLPLEQQAVMLNAAIPSNRDRMLVDAEIFQQFNVMKLDKSYSHGNCKGDTCLLARCRAVIETYPQHKFVMVIDQRKMHSWNGCGVESYCGHHIHSRLRFHTAEEFEQEVDIVALREWVTRQRESTGRVIKQMGYNGGTLADLKLNQANLEIHDGVELSLFLSTSALIRRMIGTP